MATELSPEKLNIYQEETDFKSAVSEQLLSKIGASINFINDRQMSVYDFKFLGPFHSISGGEDSALPMVFDAEICAIAFRLRDCGSSGFTEVDLHKISSSGSDSGSLLSTKIKVGHADSNEAGFFKNFIAGTSNDTSVYSMVDMSDANRLLSAGESIRLDIDSAATDARDLAVYVYYRPR